MMNTVIIGLGSNIEADQNIAQAKSLLNEQFKGLKESQFIQTKPIGYLAQDDFLNGAVLVETPLNLEQVKGILQEMEKQLGREDSSVKYGPRTIDLDIIVWNNQVIDADFYEREFLKMAVLELLPELKY
jgi:2-amino-4-hydroxy-6-hydroxymethyldihydropteridine diphosphokinase